MVISFLSALLIMSALFCFYKALDLIPTDIGLTWLQGGFTLFSAGIIVLAMALAVRALRSAVPMAAGNGTSPRIEPVAPSASESAPALEAVQGIGTAGKAGAALAAGAAAGAMASLAYGASTESGAAKQETLAGDAALAKAPEDRILEELERDLFDEIPKAKAFDAALDEKISGLTLPEVSDVEPLPASQDPGSQESRPEEAAAPDTLFSEDHASNPMDKGFGPDAPEAGDERSPTLEAPAIEDLLEPAPEMVLGPMLPEPDALGTDEAEAVVEMPPAPVSPGLIADADLAALQDEGPVLAPLETLDVVGSYDSGGSRFTMYSDGSVNTVGPDGERRFRNLEALRAHIDAMNRG